MRIGIIHNSLNSTGGGERLCLKMIEALKDSGYEVILGTTEPTNWDKVEKTMGMTVRPDRELSLLKAKMRIFGIYMRLLTTFLALKMRRECDIVVNTHGDILFADSDIIYMHYPTFAILRETPVNTKYSSSLIWRIYFTPYEKIQNILVRRYLDGIILTNSTFSRDAIKRYTGRDAIVVYPPVEIEAFSFAAKSDERENIIVSCGRYTPEKNYEFILEVAEKLRDEPIRFVVVGASSGKISKRYYMKLEKIRKAKGLENVEFLRDIDFSKLIALYSKSKIYLHAMRNEHFGISVVEAMAAGLVPVIHRSGGPWQDILRMRQGVHGFSYTTASEAAEIIRELIVDERKRRRIVANSMGYLEVFSEEEFKRRISDIVERVYDYIP
ncbi:glycosyltransferase [Candidatus Bathyarchaeota archaeon]|nr:glycosyltransferase [Candidatus Bathyarchaeota archaeon]